MRSPACPPGDGSPIRLLCRLSGRTLTAMHSWQPLTYALEPHGTFTPDPGGCPHCAYQLVNVDDPEYRHRHWTPRRKALAAPELQDGPVWRFWYWVFSDWGMGRRAGQAPAPRPADDVRQG